MEEFDSIKNTINNLSYITSTLSSMLYVSTDVVPTVEFLVSKFNTIYLYNIESSMVLTNMYFIMRFYQSNSVFPAINKATCLLKNENIELHTSNK